MNRAPDTLPRGYNWRDDAECRRPEYDPELWHPAGTTGLHLVQIGEAKQICARCPVMEECGRWALTHTESGVWGGMSEQERSSYRRRIQRAASTGTEPAPARTPVIVYASHEKAYRANVLPDGDHLVWVGGKEVKVDGRRLSARQAVWWATRGRAPVGRVFTDCDLDGCVLHISDQPTRDTRQAAEKAAREAAREAAQQVSKCGTRYGYQLHRQAGETACQPCKDANAAANRRLCDTGTSKVVKPSRAQCGTNSGYQTHRNRREPICDACRQAHAETGRQYRQDAKAKRPTTTPDCGTASGRRSHLDRGEAPCAPCMDAHARTDWLLKNAAAV